MSEQNLPVIKQMDAIEPTAGGGMMVQTHNGIITAQRVAVPREEERIFKKAEFLSTQAADKYYYRWPVKDKRGKTSYVEGPSIKLAMDLARMWGNCQVEPIVEVHPGHFMIYARFVDLETGYSLVRPFKQRRNIDMGRTDSDRADDIALQIGVSKAIRNVVVQANPILADRMFEAAKGSLVARIDKNIAGARTAIVKKLEQLDVPLGRVAHMYGRPVEKMPAPDLARLYAEIQSVEDNMVTVEDVWPAGEDEGKEEPKKVTKEKKEEPKPKAKEKPVEKAEEPAPEPAPEPEPEPEPEQMPEAEEPEEDDLTQFNFSE